MFLNQIFIFANQMFETSILKVINHHISLSISYFWSVAFIKIP